MNEKTDTGEEVKDPSDSLQDEPPKPRKSRKPKKKTEPDPLDMRRKELLEKIETHQNSILFLHKRIELTDSLQSIIKSLSGAKIVELYYDRLDVSVPDVETLGVFFRELEHLKSKMPKVELTYSGGVSKDEVLAKVRIENWG